MLNWLQENMGLIGESEFTTMDADVMLFMQKKNLSFFFFFGATQVPPMLLLFVRKSKWSKIHYVIPDKISF